VPGLTESPYPPVICPTSVARASVRREGAKGWFLVARTYQRAVTPGLFWRYVWRSGAG
jgi:hypothetical protein